jgi:hypothetical protein
MEDQGFDLARFWMEGGAAMYLVALTWLAAEVAGAMAIVLRSAAVSLVALALSSMPLTVGVLGMVYNRHVVAEAVAMVNPLQKDVIQAQGNQEAMRPLQLGGVLTLFTAPLAVIALSRSPRKKGSGVQSITDPER